MLFSTWLQNLRSPWARTGLQTLRQTPRRRGPRLLVEQLEDRLVPSNFSAASVSDLIADINAANRAGGTNTITLTATTNSPYILTAVDNATDGATGLPVIAANNNLTILGNGDTVARSTVTGTPAFRLLDVAGGASLTLENLTLQGGLARGSGTGVSAEGGGIYSLGSLTLNGVIVQNNQAQGHNPIGSGDAAGGGLFVAGGTAMLTNDILSANKAQGGSPGIGAAGGSGFGGGLYVSGGKVTLTGDTLSSNSAQGGAGGYSFGGAGGTGGNGFGGGVYGGGGTIIMHNDSVTGNTAQRGAGGGHGLRGWSGRPGLGEGGGLYIDPAATVDLDAFTVANILNNTASTSDPNIHGSYHLLP